MNVSGSHFTGTEKTSLADLSELSTIQANGASRPIAKMTRPTYIAIRATRLAG